MSSLHIVFNRDIELRFELETSPITDLWLEKMRVRHDWSLDDPGRFYGFDEPDIEQDKAEKELRRCIGIINEFQPIIQDRNYSVNDQDSLNYLHHIFETYHGLLDQQNSEWWCRAPKQVQQALADLNIAVHRAETSRRRGQPRFVCTWFGMPKKERLNEHLITKHGKDQFEFGGVYLNYVEIGKTLEELSIDDDQWIGDDAFRPFLHYSADFNVRFYDEEIDLEKASGYFFRHAEFFARQGINDFVDYRVRPYRFLLARLQSDLSREEILINLSKNQLITDIYIT